MILPGLSRLPPTCWGFCWVNDAMLHVHVGVKVLNGLKETSIGNIAQARVVGDTSGFQCRLLADSLLCWLLEPPRK